MLVAGFLVIGDNARAQDELDKPLTDQPVTEELEKMEQVIQPFLYWNKFIWAYCPFILT